MIALLAQPMWRDGSHMNGDWWWVMAIGWLIFVAAVVVTAFVLIRSLPHGNTAGPHSADQILDDRFARGEIDEQEYRQRRAALRS